MPGPTELLIAFFVVGFVIAAILVFLGVTRVFTGASRIVDNIGDLQEAQLRAISNRPLHVPDLWCDHCGARLDDDAEISPSGDVKCPYCAKWFNLYRSRAEVGKQAESPGGDAE